MSAQSCRSLSFSLPAGPVLPLREVERRYVLAVLQLHGGNRSAASQALGICMHTLYKKFADWGMPMPPPPPPGEGQRHPRRAEALALRRQGQTLSAICRQLGMSRTVLRKWLAQEGLGPAVVRQAAEQERQARPAAAEAHP